MQSELCNCEAKCLEVLLWVAREAVEHLKCEKPEQLWKYRPGWLGGRELKPPAESGGDVFHGNAGGKMNFPSALRCRMTTTNVRRMRLVDRERAFFHSLDHSSQHKKHKEVSRSLSSLVNAWQTNPGMNFSVNTPSVDYRLYFYLCTHSLFKPSFL